MHLKSKSHKHLYKEIDSVHKPKDKRQCETINSQSKHQSVRFLVPIHIKAQSSSSAIKLTKMLI